MKKIFAASVIVLLFILYGLPFIFTSDIMANVKSEMKEYTGEFIKEKKENPFKKNLSTTKDEDFNATGWGTGSEDPLPGDGGDEDPNLWVDSPLPVSDKEMLIFLFLPILYSIRVLVKQRKKKRQEKDDFELYEE
ncbi:MAG: hypothetical protein LUG18_14320 [Candidatus Azobacteroides sp.]|nr:hypothetical protein [Candidatus Azobacteroides sp.]